VSRLARHPSVVLYSGCNENLWGYYDWGWRDTTEGRTWGEGYYFDLLPRVAAELDPTRPYWPGSPYSGAWNPVGDPHPNASDFGNRHVWEPWRGTDHPVIGHETPRFCSEFGFQGPPAYATLARVVAADDRRFDSAVLVHHQRSEKGEAASRALTAAYFGDGGEVDFAEEHARRQVAQARAVTRMIEWFRCQMPRCMGAIFWQLNDCWPVVSWSAIDADGRDKPLWHAARRAFADRIVTFQPASQPARAGSDEVALFLVNDSSAPWDCSGRIRRVRFDGMTLAEQTFHETVPRRSVGTVTPRADLLVWGDATTELLVVEVERLVAYHFGRADHELALPPPQITAEVEPHEGGCTVHLSAHTIVRDVLLRVDMLDPDASASDQIITMLPGDRVSVGVRSTRALSLDALSPGALSLDALSPAALTRPPVFWCAPGSRR
jgi:beta-mannosidase